MPVWKLYKGTVPVKGRRLTKEEKETLTSYITQLSGKG